MKRESLFRRGLVGSLAVLLLCGALVELRGQDPASPPTGGAATKAEPKKPRGRLPAYYGRVITDPQRQQIYDIQTKFNEQIEQLREEMESLVAQRDAEVAAVLTPEQRAQIEALRAEAKTKRASAKSDGGADGG